MESQTKIMVIWGELLKLVHTQRPLLVPRFKNAIPISLTDGELTLGFHPDAEFTRITIENPKNLAFLNEILQSYFGHPVRIRTTLLNYPESVNHNDFQKIEQNDEHNIISIDNAFREKYKAEYRTEDGHYVRSKAEVLIDNWLYHAGIVHAYERKLPIEQDVYSDFYVPQKKIYIEFWGSEDKKYLSRKKEKQNIYKKYHLNLIELIDKDVANIDDALPRKLIKFGVQIV